MAKKSYNSQKMEKNDVNLFDSFKFNKLVWDLIVTVVV